MEMVETTVFSGGLQRQTCKNVLNWKRKGPILHEISPWVRIWGQNWLETNGKRVTIQMQIARLKMENNHAYVWACM